MCSQKGYFAEVSYLVLFLPSFMETEFYRNSFHEITVTRLGDWFSFSFCYILLTNTMLQRSKTKTDMYTQMVYKVQPWWVALHIWWR